MQCHCLFGVRFRENVRAGTQLTFSSSHSGKDSCQCLCCLSRPYRIALKVSAFLDPCCGPSTRCSPEFGIVEDEDIRLVQRKAVSPEVCHTSNTSTECEVSSARAFLQRNTPSVRAACKQKNKACALCNLSVLQDGTRAHGMYLQR